MKADHWSHGGFQQIGTIPSWNKETAEVLGDFVGGVSVGWGGGVACWCMQMQQHSDFLQHWEKQRGFCKFRAESRSHIHHDFPPTGSCYCGSVIADRRCISCGVTIPSQKVGWCGNCPIAESPRITMNFVSTWPSALHSAAKTSRLCCPLPQAAFLRCLGTWFGGWYW